MSGQTCCVSGCKSSSLKNNRTPDGKKISFHCFPRDETVRDVWIERVIRERFNGKYWLWSQWTPTEYHRICGLHFNKSGTKTYNDKYPRFFKNNTYPEHPESIPQTTDCDEIILLNDSDDESQESNDTVNGICTQIKEEASPSELTHEIMIKDELQDDIEFEENIVEPSLNTNSIKESKNSEKEVEHSYAIHENTIEFGLNKRFNEILKENLLLKEDNKKLRIENANLQMEVQQMQKQLDVESNTKRRQKKVIVTRAVMLKSKEK